MDSNNNIWIGPKDGFVDPVPRKDRFDGANSLEDMVRNAVKLDKGKPAFDLMPWDALEEVAKLYTLGSGKYTPRNWERGFTYGRTYAAMLRHATAWFMCKVRGTDGIDPETGMSHMVAVVWNALALLTFELRGTGTDDRPHKTPLVGQE